MSQSPDRVADSGSLGSRVSVRVLCVLVLLYIPIQWIAGRRPGSTTIFSPQHRQLVGQFGEVTSVMRRQLISQCAQNGIRDVFFVVNDVVSPYLVNEVERIPGCAFHRETEVTPNAVGPELACSAVIVYEDLPNAWDPARDAENLGPLTGKVTPVSRWESADKQFAFKLLQGSGCVHADVNETRQ